jgi:hypothetical protein
VFPKPEIMPQLIFKQIQYEIDTWKRLLAFMVDENVRLKLRLAEILKEKFNPELLEEAEIFQGRFVKADELIALLRNETSELDKLMVKEVFEDGKLILDTGRKLKKFRNHIITAEKHFGRLKVDFNSYLVERV